MYVSVSEASAASQDFDSSEVRYFSAAGKSASEREAATELAEHLRMDLEKEGVDVSLIAEDVALIQSLVLSILALFEGYLAIGLIIGIAGIGVVTYRPFQKEETHRYAESSRFYQRYGDACPFDRDWVGFFAWYFEWHRCGFDVPCWPSFCCLGERGRNSGSPMVDRHVGSLRGCYFGVSCNLFTSSFSIED